MICMYGYYGKILLYELWKINEIDILDWYRLFLRLLLSYNGLIRDVVSGFLVFLDIFF